jgi:hypothetical protein
LLARHGQLTDQSGQPRVVRVSAGLHAKHGDQVTAIPVFAWELSLAGWLIAKGFKPAASAMDIVTAAAGRLDH